MDNTEMFRGIKARWTGSCEMVNRADTKANNPALANCHHDLAELINLYELNESQVIARVNYLTENTSLKAENKRLRDALEEWVEWITKVTSYDASTLKCMEAARQALMQQPNVPTEKKHDAEI